MVIYTLLHLICWIAGQTCFFSAQVSSHARRARSAARTKYVHPMPFIYGMFIITHITHVSVYVYLYVYNIIYVYM